MAPNLLLTPVVLLTPILKSEIIMAVDALKDASTIKRTDQRKRKPVVIAVINDACTGCAGSPACVDYCPIGNCMIWVPDEEHPPFGRIEVDALLCIGCKLCISKGPEGTYLEGCPWDAIDMVSTKDYEAVLGPLPY